MAYITIDEYIAYANHPNLATDDSTVLALIAQAQQVIDDYCGRTFEADSDTVGSSNAYLTRKFDAEADIEGQELFFDRDLCEINEILNGDTDSTEISSDNYVTNPRNDVPYYSVRIKDSTSDYWTYATDPEDAISVSGIWAFSKTANNSIKQAMLRLVNWFYKQREAELDADRPVVTQFGFAVMPSSLPSDVKIILDPYKRIDIYGF
jgi:hypothetical protein